MYMSSENALLVHVYTRNAYDDVLEFTSARPSERISLAYELFDIRDCADARTRMR